MLGTLFDVTNDKKIRPNRETQSVPNHKHRDSGNVCFQHGAHALESALHGNVNARQNEQLNTQLWEQRLTRAMMIDAPDARAPASR